MKIETADRYAVIKNPYHAKVFDVYIDGSFNTEEISVTAPYGSGWAMVDKYSSVTKYASRKKLIGYGMTQFSDTHSTSTSVGELRSIIQFFEGIEQHFPQMMNRKHTYHVHCDNLNLIKNLNKSQVNQDSARSAQKRYGKDYQIILSFIQKTNIFFNWVKGHSTNEFNCFADALAYKAYQYAKAPGKMTKLERFDFIVHSVISRNLLSYTDKEELRRKWEQVRNGVESSEDQLEAPKVKRKKNPAEDKKWRLGKQLLVSTAAAETEDDTHQGVVFSMDEGVNLTSGVTIIPGSELHKTVVHLRGIQKALFAYRTAEGVDTSVPVTIRTNVKSIPRLIDSPEEAEGMNIVFCPELEKEIENLKMLMTGMQIRIVGDNNLLVSSMANYALRLARKSIAQISEQGSAFSEGKVLTRQ